MQAIHEYLASQGPAKDDKSAKPRSDTKPKLVPRTKSEVIGEGRVKRGRSKNVKRAEYNLAAIGSQRDKQGLKYSSERSIKNYLVNRKQNIRRVNQELGFNESDDDLGP